MDSTSPALRMSDLIANRLIASIRSGELPQGQPLPPERELCERFDASRPTVREALAQMQMRGFLDSGGGRRPRASRPSLQAILHSAAGNIRDLMGDAEGARIWNRCASSSKRARRARPRCAATASRSRGFRMRWR